MLLAGVMKTAEVDAAVMSNMDSSSVTVMMRLLRSPLLHVYTGAGARTIHAVGPIRPSREAHRAVAFSGEELAEGIVKTVCIS